MRRTPTIALGLAMAVLGLGFLAPQPTAPAAPAAPAAASSAALSERLDFRERPSRDQPVFLPPPTAPAPTIATTTTAAPKPPAKHKPTVAGYRGNPAGSLSGNPCGGDLPPCSVLGRENRGADPRLYNGGCHLPYGSTGHCPGGSTASGIWQFLRSTWNGFGGFLNAADAPPDVQNEKARQLWAGGRGCSHWAAC